MKRVVVGLSGGVDSSVAAYLLQQQGYEVIGMFMRNWNDESVTINNECPWVEDSNDALLVAQKLGIPFQTIDLSADYKERIVDYMFREYEQGRTPNPDVLCNREIKFDIFLKSAQQLNADFVATGHYVRKAVKIDEEGRETFRLLAGKDTNKDQSYFLCQLTQAQLSKALFPIGELQKPEVREIAKSLGLVTAEKKDSQGLCFIGKVKLPEFLKQQLLPKKGKIVQVPAISKQFKSRQAFQDAQVLEKSTLEQLSAPYEYTQEDGNVVGEHIGAHYFTVGQRKGLDVGGTKEPLFVIGTDTKENIIYTGEGKNHPGLKRNCLFVEEPDIHWVRPALELSVGESAPYEVRIRYRQPLEKATLYREEGGLYILFERSQQAIAPGQFAAWYNGQELVGSGVINR